MVKGIDIFRDRFRPFEGAVTLIGGAACDAWFASQGVEFRATRDLDIVLMVEVVDRPFVAALRSFIAEGGYQLRERSEGVPILYRFSRPTRADFPFMLELFSRNPPGLELAAGQEIVPIRMDSDHHSLSAILLDDDYYRLIQTYYQPADGLRIAGPGALIPLKSRAWMDLSRRKLLGVPIDSRSITKHRNDVFRLAATLPGEPGPELPGRVTADLQAFLRAFSVDAAEWPAILASLSEGFGMGLRPGALLDAIRTHFRLPPG